MTLPVRKGSMALNTKIQAFGQTIFILRVKDSKQSATTGKN